MELRQLEYFVAVAEEANFTRAAQRVHISQSGVSAQIRELERDLGAALLDRSGRTVTLTAAGAAALVHARAVLAAADAVRQAVDEVTAVIRGRLVIGMVTACTITALFDALASFRSAHPGVEITLLEDDSERLIERVRSGAADLALIATAAEPPSGVAAWPIVSERLVAAIPPGHPLATRARTTLAEVSAYPIVCMPTGTGIRAVFDRACAAAGLHPDIELQASAPNAIADLAMRGMGVAILSESMAAQYTGRLKSLRLTDVETLAVLALIWSSTQSPALRELLVHTRAAFTDPGTQPALGVD